MNLNMSSPDHFMPSSSCWADGDGEFMLGRLRDYHVFSFEFIDLAFYCSVWWQICPTQKFNPDIFWC